jgi:prepilin-type N-terminal cleavage/methylation domain-containing protein
MRTAKGFTLIELMIVVVIIGILAAIAIPNFIAMQIRAKEGCTKSNMHTLQLAAEDYGAQYGVYAASAGLLGPSLPGGGATFKNPFDGTTGNAYADQGTWARPLAMIGSTPGLTVYGDSSGTLYQIVGQGWAATLPLVLTSN